jgi:hypothetical protein
MKREPWWWWDGEDKAYRLRNAVIGHKLEGVFSCHSSFFVMGE